MKNCLLCGQPFSGKRKDALYCSGTCKAKYSELKRNRGLGGLQLSSAEQDSTEDKPSEKLPLANTVDAIDLEPFANIFDEFEQVHFNTTGLKQENNVVESNTTKQNKSEKSGEDEAVEQITLPKQYISKIEKQDNVISSVTARLKNNGYPIPALRFVPPGT